MIQETYDQDHYAWISEDDQLWQRGNVLFSQGLDITSNTWFINCSRKPVLRLSTDDNIECQYTLEKDNNEFLWIFFTQDKKVYTTEQNSVPVYTTAYEVNWCFKLWNYFYFFSHMGNNFSTKLYRILISDTSWSWASDVSEVTSITLPNPTEKMYLIQEYPNFIVMTLWRKIIRLDDKDWAWTLAFDEYKTITTTTVVWIVKTESWVKVIERWWRIVLWNIVKNIVDWEFFSWMKNIKFVWQIWGIEYAIIWSSLYLLNWVYFEKQISEYYSDVLGKYKSVFNVARWIQNSIIIMNWIWYFIWTTPWFTHVKLNANFPVWAKSVMTYWAKIRWLSPALNHFLYRSSRNKPYLNIYWISSINERLYVSFEDADWYWVDEIDLSIGNYEQAQMWIVQYLNLDWRMKLKNKFLQKITLVSKIPLNDWKIIVFKIQDWSITYLTWDEETSTIKKVTSNEVDWEYELKCSWIPFRNLSILLFLDQSEVWLTPNKNNWIKHYWVIYSYEWWEKHKQ